VILLLAGCLPQRPEPDRCPRGPHLLVATTNYEVGALATVDPETGCLADALATTGPDALVRTLGDRVVLANRAGGDSVLVYEPGFYPSPIVERVVQRRGNVHDVVAVGDEWWFSLYERAELVRTDRSGREVGRIALDDEADGDGLPEADRLVVTEAGVFAALQRLDREAGWTGDEGRIVRIDPKTGRIEARFTVGPNPKLYADPSDPSALVVLTGRYGEPDGALLGLDPDTGATSAIVTEEALGLDLSGFAGIGSHAVLLGVDFAVDGPSTVLCLDLETGALAPGRSDTVWFVDAVAGDGSVHVAVRGGFSGIPADAVLSVDPATCASETLAEGFVLEPYGLAYVP
jgi:hypothetical protein